jgi:hypothetical protein
MSDHFIWPEKYHVTRRPTGGAADFGFQGDQHDVN